MGETPVNPPHLLESSRRLLHRLLAVGENRFELFVVEVQEERERLLHALFLTLGMVAFGMLSGIAFTFAIVMLLWDTAPTLALFILTAVYGGAALALYLRLRLIRQDWKTLPATLDQFQKDRACLEKKLT